MRTHRLLTLSLLVCACPGDVATTPGDTTELTGTDATSSTTAPEPTTGPDDPAPDTTGPDTDTTAPANPGDSTTTGDPPANPCPETLPAPVDCGDMPEICGDATPIAGGPTIDYVQGPALTRDHAWFMLAGSDCPGAIYRVSTSGGDAQWVRPLYGVLDFAADDDALYFVEITDDAYTMRISAVLDGVETVLGETHGDRRYNTYFNTYLTRTHTGVVTFDTGGAKHPPFIRLTPTSFTPIGNRVDDVYLGSEPAYDGERLFYSLSDPKFDDEPGHISVDGSLVDLEDGASAVLAGGAHTRGAQTVAVDAEHIYFVTGDPSKRGESSLMGVSRVAKSGGPATPLFASIDQFIDKLLIDDTHVYFHRAPYDIYAVEKSGGTPRHVWHGAQDFDSAWIDQDADDLYFTVKVSAPDIPVPNRAFIARIAKDTEIP